MSPLYGVNYKDILWPLRMKLSYLTQKYTQDDNVSEEINLPIEEYWSHINWDIMAA